MELLQGEQYMMEVPQEEQSELRLLQEEWVVRLPQQEQHVMGLPQEEQPEEETMAAPAAAQEVARAPLAQDQEMGYKIVAPLDGLQKTGGDEDNCGDEMKLRVGSPAIIDYACMYINPPTAANFFSHFL